tara:strand:+ start:375 stop:1040 length:666 start_codon:yes stop_codon:yes gene_type:complete
MAAQIGQNKMSDKPTDKPKAPKAKGKAKTPIQAKRHKGDVLLHTGGQDNVIALHGTNPSGIKRVPQIKRIGAIKGPASQVTGLTDKQEAFVQAYMSGENASDAYRSAYDAAGMKPSTIWTEACLLLQNQKVANRIAAINMDLEAQQRMGRLKQSEFVLKQLMSMALQGQNEGARVRSLELLGKHAGMFKDVLIVDDAGADRSAAQIENDIADRLKRLGMGK